MSDEKEKPNLKVVEFDKTKTDRKEASVVVTQMFEQLAERARQGDIDDFIITFKSSSRGVESMIGGLTKGFDFVGYVGMLEVLKQRLLAIMLQASYAYAFTPKKEESKDEDPKKED